MHICVWQLAVHRVGVGACPLFPSRVALVRRCLTNGYNGHRTASASNYTQRLAVLISMDGHADGMVMSVASLVRSQTPTSVVEHSASAFSNHIAPNVYFFEHLGGISRAAAACSSVHGDDELKGFLELEMTA